MDEGSRLERNAGAFVPHVAASHRAQFAIDLLAAFAWGQPAWSARPANQNPGSDRNPLVYVLTHDTVTGAAGFGAAHLGSVGLVRIGSTHGPSLLSMGYSGTLYSIDARTGAATVVGTTGLGANAVTLGMLDGKYYAIDVSQHLYSLDPATGATKAIGPTGIPQITFVPFQIDPSDGKLDVYDESLFSFRGKLYANLDTGKVDLTTGSETAVIQDALYEIDPETGRSRMIAPTDLGLLTIVNVNDTIYAFDSINDRFVTIDMRNGRAEAVSNLDPAAGFVCGATPVAARH